jgi:hypothetical protein
LNPRPLLCESSDLPLIYVPTRQWETTRIIRVEAQENRAGQAAEPIGTAEGGADGGAAPAEAGVLTGRRGASDGTASGGLEPPEGGDRLLFLEREGCRIRWSESYRNRSANRPQLMMF